MKLRFCHTLLLFCTLMPCARAQFGTNQLAVGQFKGTVYMLPQSFIDGETDQRYSDQLLKGLKPSGSVFVSKLDIPARDFTEGFPGVSDRYEWFALYYTGSFSLPKAGNYRWKLNSDDGSRLWIDGKEVIDNDGVHGPSDAEGETQLAAGMHSIAVWYYQGPAAMVALQLSVQAPGAEEYEIFDIDKYNASAKAAAGKLLAKTEKDGIRIQLPDKILFDIGKSELKPEAESAIKDLIALLQYYPNASIIIEGHTDNVGDAAMNQGLSERRAASVASRIKPSLATTVKLSTKGYGATKPLNANANDAERALNRRVEVLVRP